MAKGHISTNHVQVTCQRTYYWRSVQGAPDRGALASNSLHVLETLSSRIYWPSPRCYWTNKSRATPCKHGPHNVQLIRIIDEYFQIRDLDNRFIILLSFCCCKCLHFTLTLFARYCFVVIVFNRGVILRLL